MNKRILIVEDEKDLSRLIALELQTEGYEVATAKDGRTGLEMALSKNFDLILLDLLLPEMDGFELMRRLLAEKNPYIMLMSDRDSVIDIVTALDKGADAYLVKPFAIEELLARVRAIFRRSDAYLGSRAQNGYSDRDLVLNSQNRSVMRQGVEIPLTKREFDLLSVLLANQNRVMKRETLLDAVWKYDENTETNVVDVYVRYLRGKIDIKGKESYIQTVRGIGYVIRSK